MLFVTVRSASSEGDTVSDTVSETVSVTVLRSVSDVFGGSVSFTVSEETGAVSCAIGGMLKRHLSKETLEKLLYNELAPRSELKKRSKLAERKG